MRHLILTLCMLVAAAGSAAANQNLRDIKSIDDTVFDVAVANEIRKNCPDISARVLPALSLYRSLRTQARALGFTDEQIDAYADSDWEKARMRARGDVYFRANGVVASDPQSYCALGRREIQKSSRIGSLLREK